MFCKMLFYLIIAAFLKLVVTIETTREMEGRSNGYLRDCPGSTKEARISRRSLKHLHFTHLQKGHFLTANRTQYNYHQMKILAKNLDFRKKTLVFQNGYLDTSNGNVMTPSMGALYASLDYNVLMMEYIHFMVYPYPVAARLLRPIGLRAAEMLVQLTTYGLDPKKVELVGVSHGGQGVSFIGKHFKRLTGTKVSRLTGLDPSGPCFRNLGPEDRIDASDADKVDIIHSNSDIFGFAGAVGHVNFYLNGGEYQIFDIVHFFPCGSFCSHIRSWSTWFASVSYPDLFIGIKCNTIQEARDKNCSTDPVVTNLMGPKTDFNKTGIFHLATSNLYPYGLGLKGIKKGYDRGLELMAKLNEPDVFENKWDLPVLGLPRLCSASVMFAEARTDGFLAWMRKKIASCLFRLHGMVVPTSF